MADTDARGSLDALQAAFGAQGPSQEAVPEGDAAPQEAPAAEAAPAGGQDEERPRRVAEIDERRLALAKDAPSQEGDAGDEADLEFGTSGSATSTFERVEPLPRELERRSSGGARNQSGTTYLKGLPNSVMDMMKASYPRVRNVDAATAWIVAMSGLPASDFPDLTDEQRRLVAAFERRDPAADMAETLASLERKVEALAEDLRIVKVAEGFGLFDRLGFRKKTPSNEADIDAYEDGVEMVLRRLEDAAKRMRARDAARKDRDYRRRRGGGRTRQGG